MANKSVDSPAGGDRNKPEPPKKATRSTSLALSPDVSQQNNRMSNRRLMFVDQDNARPGTLRRNDKLSAEEVQVKKSSVKKPLPVAPSGPSSDSGFPDLRKARLSADSESRKHRDPSKKKKEPKPLPVKPEEPVVTRERTASTEVDTRPRSSSKEAPLPPAKPLPRPGEKPAEKSDSEAPVRPRPRSRSRSRGTDERHKVIKMKKELPTPPDTSDSDVHKN
jgi:hypothetical protein